MLPISNNPFEDSQQCYAHIIKGNSLIVAKGVIRRTISRAYRGPNNLSDWYLPSFDELNQMCKWANGQAWSSDATVCAGGTINTGAGAAGFGNYDYWSSSDRGSGFNDYARYQWFPTGLQGWTAKSMNGQNLYVRPIIAF